MAQFVNEQPLQDAAYLYDGTLEGLLTATFVSYERHEEPLDVCRDCNWVPRIGQSSIHIATDPSKAARVHRGIVSRAGSRTFTAIVNASTCDDYDTGSIIYRFIRHVVARSEERRAIPVLDEIAEPAVADLLRLSKHAVNETEKMRQFVRFSHLENGVWLARVNPNASVVPLVMGYFSSRLNDQPFIIFDEVHHLAGIYDGHTWQLIEADAANMPDPTAHDDVIRQAWQSFYDALSVEARYNPELRRQLMPKRFWRNLPEV